MIRGLLMFRGALIIRGPLTTGRNPDSKRAPDDQRAIFIGPLTVLRAPDSQKSPDIQKVTVDDFGCPGAPDSHRGPVFLASQRALRLPWRAFLSVSTQISWLLWWFRLLPPEFWPLRDFGPRGRNTLGGHTLLSPFRHVARIWPRARRFPGAEGNPYPKLHKKSANLAHFFW